MCSLVCPQRLGQAWVQQSRLLLRRYQVCRIRSGPSTLDRRQGLQQVGHRKAQNSEHRRPSRVGSLSFKQVA